MIGEGDNINKIFKLKVDNYLIVSKIWCECVVVKFWGEGWVSGFDLNVLKFKVDIMYWVGNFL